MEGRVKVMEERNMNRFVNGMGSPTGSTTTSLSSREDFPRIVRSTLLLWVESRTY